MSFRGLDESHTETQEMQIPIVNSASPPRDVRYGKLYWHVFEIYARVLKQEDEEDEGQRL